MGGGYASGVGEARQQVALTASVDQPRSGQPEIGGRSGAVCGSPLLESIVPVVDSLKLYEAALKPRGVFLAACISVLLGGDA